MERNDIGSLESYKVHPLLLSLVLLTFLFSLFFASPLPRLPSPSQFIHLCQVEVARKTRTRHEKERRHKRGSCEERKWCGERGGGGG